MRCYYNEETDASYVFRLQDHMERLIRSAKICMTEVPYTADELVVATLELIKACERERTCVLGVPGYGRWASIPRGARHHRVGRGGAYLGADALEKGIKVGVSSWRQRSNNAIPPQMKSSASYMNSILPSWRQRPTAIPRPLCSMKTAMFAKARARISSRARRRSFHAARL